MVVTPSRSALLRALLWITALCVSTAATHRAWSPGGLEASPLDLSFQWIASGNPDAAVTQFRKGFVLSSQVKSAWIAVAPVEGYELVVNEESAGHAFLERPTRPYQHAMSERGQTLDQAPPTLTFYPREFQWETFGLHRQPIFHDIAPFLSLGKNAICLEVESRSKPAKVAFVGEIVLWSGERIPITSDSTFKAAPIPPEEPRLWLRSDFSDRDWPPARPVEPPGGTPVRTLDPDVFREPFQGHWLESPEATHDATWYETTWRLDRAPPDAWVRIATNQSFTLFVNDVAVRTFGFHPDGVDSGDWLIGPRFGLDLPDSPEAIDPDEIDSTFVTPTADQAAPDPASRWLLPVDLAPKFIARPPPAAPPRSAAGAFQTELGLRGASQDLTIDRIQPAAPPAVRIDGIQPGAPAAVGGVPLPVDPLARAPAAVQPKELSRDRDHGGVLVGYGIAHLLHAGDNRIAVRLSSDASATPRTWIPKLAVDGQASFGPGERAVPLASAAGWSVRAQGADGTKSVGAQAIAGGPAIEPGFPLPQLQYRGTVDAPPMTFGVWTVVAPVLCALALALLGALPTLLRRVSRKRAPDGSPAAIAFSSSQLREASWVVLLPTAALLCAFLLDVVWAERDDAIALLAPVAWRYILLAASSLGVASAAVVVWGWPARLQVRLGAGDRRQHVWRALVVLTAVLCAVLRLHQLDKQPFDEDELATVRALLNVADLGLPKYNADIYYTRSPLYLYFAGAIVRVLGANVWALRLPAAFFAVATALLIYRTGERLLGSRATGLGAMLLFAVHPFAIDLGHIVRFYQQQQFFALATVYFLCRGFVSEQRLSARYLALAAFWAACLSQEISVVLLPGILVVHWLFRPRWTRTDFLKFLFVGACAAVFIAFDVLILQTWCLSRLEGISPNNEPTLAFGFHAPMNFASMLVCYSRLNLALSLILLASLPLLVRQKNPNVLAMLVTVILGVVTTNLCISGTGLRFQYWILTLLILLSVHGLRAMALAAARIDLGGTEVGRRWLSPVVAVLGFGTILLSWSIWKIPGSYASTLTDDSEAAFSYVGAHLREGDRVMASEPYAVGALLESGKVDYELFLPVYDDHVYRKAGHLVDRITSATVVTSVEELEDAVSRTDRLWVVWNNEKAMSRGADVPWRVPGARVELFLRQNLEVKFRSYLWTVFLWDVHRGKFHALPAQYAWQSGQ
jgi:hypothetical protein